MIIKINKKDFIFIFNISYFYESRKGENVTFWIEIVEKLNFHDILILEMPLYILKTARNVFSSIRASLPVVFFLWCVTVELVSECYRLI